MRKVKLLSSGFFLGSAVKSLKANDEHHHPQAIVFSALSIEIFLNELPELIPKEYITTKKMLDNFELLQLAIDKHASIELKLRIALLSIIGKYPKDIPLIKDILLLFKLRNMIVHKGPLDAIQFEPGDPEPDLPSIVNHFIARKIITKPRHNTIPFGIAWDRYLLNDGVAKWSVLTAIYLRKYCALNITSSFLKGYLSKHFQDEGIYNLDIAA